MRATVSLLLTPHPSLLLKGLKGAGGFHRALNLHRPSPLEGEDGNAKRCQVGGNSAPERSEP
jgi:hypothetical protein